MVAKLLWAAALGAVMYGGFWLLQRSWTYSVQTPTAPADPGREEEILRAFFTVDVAQKKIAHLALSDLRDFEAIAEPRPDISAVIARFGEPDSVVEEDLSPYGVGRKGRIHYFGRLGLVSPAELEVGRVFWVIIEGRASSEMRSGVESLPR